jgi:GNAT superfamily N-acetyltransferase
MSDDSSHGETLLIAFDPAPAPETRATLAREINAFNSRTFPYASERFAFLAHNASGTLQAGVMGAMSWSWLFIEAVWVSDTLRGRGVGRQLMAKAEAHASAHGCHSVWLDTFQAREFYLALDYEPFGVLDDYPAGQTRTFMRKRLSAGSTDSE